MKKIRVAINGFGRIGRAFLKLSITRDDMELVAINDLGSLENMAYLLKYDTVYGKSKSEIGFSLTEESKKIFLSETGKLTVDGNEILYLSEKQPENLPWKSLNIDVVVESTGFFASYEKAKTHLFAGAKRVVISAPVKDEPEKAGVTGATVLMGVNEEKLKTCDISSNASCTTNAGSPVIAILNEELGIEKALLNTVHGYTASQSIVDGPNKKDAREGRAAAQNIVPTSTGAAIATTKAITDLKDKFDGIAIRVPVPAGSLVDITFLAKRETNAEEVNAILRKASMSDRWKEVFAVTDEQIVSSDILGEPHASIADLSMTRVVGGNLVKVLAWYDNEMGYANTLVKHVLETGKYV